MITVLHFAKNLWKKNIASNIMVMIIVSLACLMTSGVYNSVSQIYSDYFYFKDTPVNRSLLYMGGDRYEEGFMVDSEYQEKMTALAAEKEELIEGVSQMMSFGYDSANRMHGSVYVYDEITASYLKKGIRGKGEWIFDSPVQDGVYPIVVKNGSNNTKLDENGALLKDDDGNTIYFPEYGIGDIVDLEINMYKSVHQSGNFVLPRTVTVKCKVVGLVYDIEPFPFFLGNIYGTLVNDVRNQFRHYMDDEHTCIFFPYSEELFGDFDFCYGTSLYYFSDSASEESIMAFYAEARQIGLCTLGSDIIEETKSTADYAFNRYFFVCYTLIGLSLISIVCVSFLNIKKLTKQIAIYRINGCSFLMSAAMYFTYFIAMYIVSFLMFLGAAWLQYFCEVQSKGADFAATYLPSVKTAFVIFFAGLAVSAISALIPFIFIRKKTPAENLKVH